MKTIRVGLVGLGNIGSGVYDILRHKSTFLAKRTGVKIELAYACDARVSAKKRLSVPSGIFARDFRTILNDPAVDIVIELMGGINVARRLILGALGKGKYVVTANKALLAEYGPEIFRVAERADREVYFEASVGGGIPIIKVLRESFIANRIVTIHSIINGTCNYILTKMAKEHLDFQTALRGAQAEGFAEADPTLDISGIDAAHKITIMSMLAFGGIVPFHRVSVEGITGITSDDIGFAQEFGYVVKLLAMAKKTADGVDARVQPTLLPKSHILASIDYSFNGILLHGDEVGDILLYGRGAGRKPTSSAVVSDVVDLARLIRSGKPGLPLDIRRTLKVKSISDIESRYYVRLTAFDRPGVLAGISSVLAKAGVSISDVVQRERKAGRAVPLILLTHPAREETVRRVVQRLNKLPSVRGQAQVIRIED